MIGLSAAPGTAAPLDLLHGFEGVYSGWIPADPAIAAGPDSLVTMVSGRIAVFSKQGGKLFEQALGSGGFWAAQGADQVAEPCVIFDPNSGRFIASAADFGSRKGFLYFAVSKHSNPVSAADWHKYSLDRTGVHQKPGFSGVATYPDFAKLGVDHQAVYVTSLQFEKQAVGAGFSHAEIFAIEKAPLLAGGAFSVIEVAPVIVSERFSWIQPALVFGVPPAMYFVESVALNPGASIVVHAVTDLFTTPTITSSPVTVAAFDKPPTVPQRGSSIPLENIDARLLSAVVRNGSLWTAHGIRDPLSDGESLVRWYEFDVAGLPATGATLVQSGNVDPGPGVHAWLPAINADADGNMGLVCSVGGASQYASIGYTGRLVSAPAGTTLPVRIARAGAGPYTMGGWGEYGGLAMDPDGSTFWLLHEYPTKQKVWRTFVGAFRLGSGDAVNAPPSADAGPDQSVTDTDNNGVEVVALNGAYSADADGSIVSWRWSEGSTVLGTGVTMSAILSVGIHAVVLTVTDDAGASDSDTVVVEVRRKRGR